jgi:hypothetical protein
MRIFGPKRVEITVGRKRSHNWKLHNMYSPDIREIKIKATAMNKACSMHETQVHTMFL